VANNTDSNSTAREKLITRIADTPLVVETFPALSFALKHLLQRVSGSGRGGCGNSMPRRRPQRFDRRTRQTKTP
jgi:hypothetical protein